MSESMRVREKRAGDSVVRSGFPLANTHFPLANTHSEGIEL